MEVPSPVRDVKIVSPISTFVQNKSTLEQSASSSLLLFIIIIIIIIVSIITVFAGVLFVHQPGANHAPRASVTQVNHSVHTLSTFLRIRADPSMQIF